MKRAKQESDSESGRESESTEREKDGYLAFNQLGHWTLVEGRNNFCCKGKFNMLSVFVVAIVVEKIPVYQWVLMGLGGGGGYKSHFPAYFWYKSKICNLWWRYCIKRAMRWGCLVPEQYLIKDLSQYLIEMHLTANYLKGFPK